MGEKIMAFNQAWLTTTRHGDYGLTKGCDQITIEGIKVPSGYWEAEPSDKAPLYRIVYRDYLNYIHLEPVEQPKGKVGPMANGVYADVSSSDFITNHIEKILGHRCPDLIPVHDRFETQEQYDLLSR